MNEEVKELIRKVVKGELSKEALPKPILIEDLGMEYPTKNSKQKARFGIYECGFCGKEFRTQLYRVKSGHTKSCGCYKKENRLERNTKHGLRYTRLYNIWKNMKDRTLNPKNRSYENYGGRGITICDEWAEDFMSFHDWSISNGYEENKGLSIDRIDNDGNYYPENCRWATQTIQCRNQGIRKDNTSGYKGVSYFKDIKKYTASIRINRITRYLGSFSTAVEGAIAYNNYIIENNLEGFILNEIPEDYLNKNKKEEDN